MKKILVTRKLIKDSEEKASKIFDAKFNSNDELYSQSKLIELSKDHDAILTSLTDKMDEDTINKLPNSIKVISNYFLLHFEFPQTLFCKRLILTVFQFLL